MSAAEQIQRGTKAALKERDRIRVGVLRMIGAALKNGEIEAGRTLEEHEEQTILRRQLKQREESVEAFRKAGREERAASEAVEAWLGGTDLDATSVSVAGDRVTVFVNAERRHGRVSRFQIGGDRVPVVLEPL